MSSIQYNHHWLRESNYTSSASADTHSKIVPICGATQMICHVGWSLNKSFANEANHNHGMILWLYSNWREGNENAFVYNFTNQLPLLKNVEPFFFMCISFFLLSFIFFFLLVFHIFCMHHFCAELEIQQRGSFVITATSTKYFDQIWANICRHANACTVARKWMESALSGGTWITTSVKQKKIHVCDSVIVCKTWDERQRWRWR